MTDKKPKIKDDEIMNKDNAERFIPAAIDKYFDKHMMVDAMFWREAVRLYGDKREEQGKPNPGGFLMRKKIRKFLYDISYYYRRIMLGSYSQYGEDLVIERELWGINEGRYIDVGAYDPKYLSNTYRLYRLGWRGVLVEPNLKRIEKLINNRKGDTVIAAGIGERSGTKLLYTFAEDALNTFDITEAIKNLSRCRYTGQFPVPITTLEGIQNRYGEADFLSIDTEGYDLEVLKGNDWAKYQPALICIEDNKDGGAIYKYLTAKGYHKRYSNGTNSLYARE